MSATQQRRSVRTTIAQIIRGRPTIQDEYSALWVVRGQAGKLPSVIVPKRVSVSAVVRNRIRRQFQGALLRIGKRIPQAHRYVVRVKTTRTLPPRVLDDYLLELMRKSGILTQ